jgi:hypothetical protein
MKPGGVGGLGPVTALARSGGRGADAPAGQVLREPGEQHGLPLPAGAITTADAVEPASVVVVSAWPRSTTAGAAVPQITVAGTSSRRRAAACRAADRDRDPALSLPDVEHFGVDQDAVMALRLFGEVRHRVDPHDRVGGVERDAAQPRDGRYDRS